MNSGYRIPPRQIVELIEAAKTPDVLVSPGLDKLLLLEHTPFSSLPDLARPEVILAGLAFSPDTLVPSRPSVRYRSVRFLRTSDGAETRSKGLRDDGIILHASWSPDSSTVAVSVSHDRGVDLWCIDAVTGDATCLVRDRLHVVIGASSAWHPDGKRLYCKLRAAETAQSGGRRLVPVTQVSDGRSGPTRTYRNLLRTDQEADELVSALSVVVAEVNLAGVVRTIGSPAMIRSALPSPNGEWLLIQKVERPFSFAVPFHRFPRRYELWTSDGLRTLEVGYQPLDERRPLGRDAAGTGQRGVRWCANSDASLFWVQACDRGDPRADVPVRDEVYRWEGPFHSSPVRIAELRWRYEDVWWGESGITLISERWFRERSRRVWLLGPSPGEAPRLILSHSTEDRFADPGIPMQRRGLRGPTLVHPSGPNTILLKGEGASPDGDRPFVDQLDLDNLRTTRLWESTPPHYEAPLHVLRDDGSAILTLRESLQEPPNYCVRMLGSARVRPLTRFPDPYPSMAGIRKELITYRREDGHQLSAMLYLPAGFDERSKPGPVLLWAYPREFKEAKAAGQPKGSPFRFPQLTWGSPVYWTALGLPVLDGPAMPIIGHEGVEPNDRFVRELTMNAEAAVRELIRRGIAQEGRIAVGGHSYGAFMAANLLAHTELFCAGIARSGAYCRTLTPFGFQAEERTLWESMGTYMEMSPYLHADRIRAPLLLMHGVEDTNPGTAPLQSELMFHALRGLGKEAKLVVFPHEGHAFRARESILHAAWETWRWLSRHLDLQDWMDQDDR